MDNFERIKLYDLNRMPFDWILLAMTGLSNGLQIFTIWLIWRKSPEAMLEYRFYLFGVTFSDFVFNFTIGFVIMPKLWMPDSLGSHSIGVAALFGPNGGLLLYGIAAFALSSQLLFQLFSTIYRFANVLSMEHAKLHTKINRRSSRICMLLICATIPASMAFVSYNATITPVKAFGWHFDGYNNRILPLASNSSWHRADLNMSKEMDGVLAEKNLNEIFNEFQPTIVPDWLETEGMYEIEASPNEIRARVEYVIRADKNYTNEMAHLLNAIRAGFPIIYFDYLSGSFLAMCSLYFAFIFIAQGICLYASVQIIRYLRKHQPKFSTQTYQLQMQLIILLIIQMFQPILLLALPISFVLLSMIELNVATNRNTGAGNKPARNSIFGIFSRPFAESILLLFIAHSIANSLLVNTFVAPYRREIIGMCKKLTTKAFGRPLMRRPNVIHPLAS